MGDWNFNNPHLHQGLKIWWPVPKYWFKNERHTFIIISALSGFETDVVYLMNMPQHKWVGAWHMMIGLDSEVPVIRLTADDMNERIKAVCCCIENHMITPRATVLHVCKIICPWSITIDEVEQICSIWL